MFRVFIVAAAGVQDQQGSLEPLVQAEAQVRAAGLKVDHLVIDPLSAGWDTPLEPGHYRSGCGPLEALAWAHARLREGLAEAVWIGGEDALRTGYTRQEREGWMQIYGEKPSLPEAYTELARHFCGQQGVGLETFRQVRDAIFENCRTQAQDVKVDRRWFENLTPLFRGVDCANPHVDYAGGVLLLRGDLLDCIHAAMPAVRVLGTGLGFASGDGPEHLRELAAYAHLEAAVREANFQAGLNFAEVFNEGQALMEAYTCYPVVPMAFLLRGGFVRTLEEIPRWLAHHALTLKGGMNLHRAPWNLPALRALVDMTQALQQQPFRIGGVHANGGLGYRQGFVILGSPGK
jgi:hypothetical protein